MKVLLDTCVWGGAVSDLRSAGHDAVWSGDWEKDPGDEEILARAHSEHRVLVTLDKDLGELAIVHRTPHSGIIRLVDFPARLHGLVCLKIISRYGEELLSGAIITADSRKIRIRPPHTEE